VKVVYWVVTALVALLLVIFAVSNRQSVAVTFWPLPVLIEAPIYLIVLLATVLGFLFGELVAWIGGRRSRRDARQKRRRVEALERELAATQAQLRPAAAPVAARVAIPGAPRD
jgi:uncharacterized integral membrane protein